MRDFHAFMRENHASEGITKTKTIDFGPKIAMAPSLLIVTQNRIDSA
jgi:hypothetical protein